jgi:AraC family transcriptional regulator of adaptative response/methylated-DNA-[protein]-cysteine methyltransferase
MRSETMKNSLPTPKRDYTSDEQKWQALLGNDARADGVFYYSVKTTGIYCRPSCASRPPMRENAMFHETCEAAEAAGFRACKRCQPRGLTLSAQYAGMVHKACRIIEAGEVAPKLDDLARQVGMSSFHFHRTFKKVTGLSPKAYAKARRAEDVRKKLARRGSVTEAIYDAGYQSSSRFYSDSSRMLGMKPQAFRAGGTGMVIHFALGECSLGSILVAASELGVCAISLGNSPSELVNDFQTRFPPARLIGADPVFENWVAKIVGFVEQPQLGIDLPLDIRGTAFQQRVWRALGEIRLGNTASYTEIAQRIGMPNAIRAVARACGANELAVAIPCHRVVRADGALSGYRWGVQRKRTLLEREKTA